MPLRDERLEGLPTVGQVVAGKYRVDDVIASGGMSVILAATHLQLEEKVAIKVLSSAVTPERIARFMREAWASTKIKSEHVARVTDVGQLEGGRAYLVMELLDGEDLSYLIRRGPVSIEQAVDFILQACEALAEAHKHGIVHRDLKPANLFLTKRADGLPWIKVLDFGISKVLAGVDALTKTAALMGSPIYMAPEQLSSTKYVDTRADLWAVGVIFYELVSGQVPFVGDNLPEVCTAVLHDQPRPLHQALVGCPAELDAVIGRCLRKTPADRWQNLAELALALAPFGGPRAALSAEYVCRVLEIAGPAAAPANLAEMDHVTLPMAPETLPTVRTTIDEDETELWRPDRSPASVTTTMDQLALGAAPWDERPVSRWSGSRAALVAVAGCIVVAGLAAYVLVGEPAPPTPPQPAATGEPPLPSAPPPETTPEPTAPPPPSTATTAEPRASASAARAARPRRADRKPPPEKPKSDSLLDKQF
jgi:eukaryotic-like serine/threonine-protein kinase